MCLFCRRVFPYSSEQSLDPTTTRNLVRLKATIDHLQSQILTVLIGVQQGQLLSWEEVLDRYTSIMWAFTTTLSQLTGEIHNSDDPLAVRGLPLHNMMLIPREIIPDVSLLAYSHLFASQPAPKLRQIDEESLTVAQTHGRVLPANPMEALTVMQQLARHMKFLTEFLNSSEGFDPSSGRGVLYRKDNDQSGKKRGMTKTVPRTPMTTTVEAHGGKGMMMSPAHLEQILSFSLNDPGSTNRS